MLFLRLVREPTIWTPTPGGDPVGSTLGGLYVNGVWRAWTLEDALREVDGQPVASWKVDGATAVPAGRYAVEWTLSSRFKRFTPQIMNVDGFSGIRIHGGNTAEDTEGCPLVGLVRSGTGTALVNSTPARAWLDAQIEAARKAQVDVKILIENPRVAA